MSQSKQHFTCAFVAHHCQRAKGSVLNSLLQQRKRTNKSDNSWNDRTDLFWNYVTREKTNIQTYTDPRTHGQTQRDKDTRTQTDTQTLNTQEKNFKILRHPLNNLPAEEIKTHRVNMDLSLLVNHIINNIVPSHCLRYNPSKQMILIDGSNLIKFTGTKLFCMNSLLRNE